MPIDNKAEQSRRPLQPIETTLTTEEDVDVPPSNEPAILTSAIPVQSVRSQGGRISGLLHRREIQRGLVNIAVILILGVLVQISTGKFFTIANVESLSTQIAVVVVIAIAMTLVMVAGEIDVSVSGIAVLTQIIAGLLLIAGMPLIPAFILATALGGVVGLVNSALVLWLGLPSLIATIGILYVTQGVANILTNGLPLPGVPNTYGNLGTGTIFGGIPNQVLIIVVVVVIFILIQRYTRFGRHLIAVGSNRQAAFLNGVKTSRTLVYAFVLSGLAAGFGGVLYGSRIGTPIPTLDNDLLFQVIVAIVVGGASLTGGEGSVGGTLIGALLIGVVYDALNLWGVSTYWQYVALGVLLVASVASDALFHRDIFHRLRFLSKRKPESPVANSNV